VCFSKNEKIKRNTLFVNLINNKISGSHVGLGFQWAKHVGSSRPMRLACFFVFIFISFSFKVYLI
jgi:hypothetical protein